MNTLATFENTVGILVKAYLEGTLLKGDCHACAVGNICASAAGLPLLITPTPLEAIRAEAQWGDGEVQAQWGAHFVTSNAGKQHRPQYLGEVLALGYSEREFNVGRAQMSATGYTINQLARIEYAFETAASGYNEEAEFAGLMAVVDVLADIHGIDLTTTEAAKALFVRA